MNIREMAASDAESCRHIFMAARRQAFHWVNGSHFQLDDLDSAIQGEIVWVSAIDDIVVGFVSVYLPNDFVHHLFVDPCRQRMGVGGHLLRFALERMGRPAELKCLSANVPACRFYEQRGWRELDRGIDELGEYIRYRLDT